MCTVRRTSKQEFRRVWRVASLCAAALGTEFRVYAMNYHSRFFAVRGTNPNIGAASAMRSRA